jgi:hypothetical protein
LLSPDNKLGNILDPVLRSLNSCFDRWKIAGEQILDFSLGLKELEERFRDSLKPGALAIIVGPVLEKRL